MVPSAAALRSKWSNAEERAAIIAALEERGIAFDELQEAAKQPDADPFDLLCHVAFNSPLRTRRERAEMLRHDKKDFFDQYAFEARAVLDEMIEKYIEYGAAQF
jgi:type I restriction enzyme R subunit